MVFSDHLENLPVDLQKYIKHLVLREMQFFTMQVIKNACNIARNKDKLTYNEMDTCSESLVAMYNYIQTSSVKLTPHCHKFIYRITDTIYQTYERFYSNSFVYWLLVQKTQNICNNINRVVYDETLLY